MLNEFRRVHPLATVFNGAKSGGWYNGDAQIIDNMINLLQFGISDYIPALLVQPEFIEYFNRVNTQYYKKKRLLFDIASTGNVDLLRQYMAFLEANYQFPVDTLYILNSLNVLVDYPDSETFKELALKAARKAVAEKIQWGSDDLLIMKRILHIDGGREVYMDMLKKLDADLKFKAINHMVFWDDAMRDYVFSNYDNEVSNDPNPSKDTLINWANILLTRMNKDDKYYIDDYPGVAERIAALHKKYNLIDLMFGDVSGALEDYENILFIKLYGILVCKEANIIELSTDQSQKIEDLLANLNHNDRLDFMIHIMWHDDEPITRQVQEVLKLNLAANDNELLELCVINDAEFGFKYCMQDEEVRKEINLDTIIMCITGLNANIADAMRKFLKLPANVKKLEYTRLPLEPQISEKGREIHIKDILYRNELAIEFPYLKSGHNESAMLSGLKIKSRTLEVQEYLTSHSKAIPLTAALAQIREIILDAIASSAGVTRAEIETHLDDPEYFATDDDFKAAWRWFKQYETSAITKDFEAKYPLISAAELANGEDIPFDNADKYQQYVANLICYCVACIKDCATKKGGDADIKLNLVSQFQDFMIAHKGEEGVEDIFEEQSCLNGIASRLLVVTTSHPRFRPDQSQYSLVKKQADLLIISAIEGALTKDIESEATLNGKVKVIKQTRDVCTALGVDNALNAMEGEQILSIDGNEFKEWHLLASEDIIKSKFENFDAFKAAVSDAMRNIVIEIEPEDSKNEDVIAVPYKFVEFSDLESLYLELRFLAINVDNSTRDAIKNLCKRYKDLLDQQIVKLKPATNALTFYRNCSPQQTVALAKATEMLWNSLHADAFKEYVTEKILASGIPNNPDLIFSNVTLIADEVFINRAHIPNLYEYLDQVAIPKCVSLNIQGDGSKHPKKV